MTCIEKLKLEHPDKVREDYQHGCPSEYGYLDDPDDLDSIWDFCQRPGACEKCWNREIPEVSLKQMEAELGLAPEEKEIDYDKHPEDNYVGLPATPGYIDGPRILDSGNRREFESGAVRDIQEGKGRCDLLPLDVVAEYLRSVVLASIARFQETNDIGSLYVALYDYCNDRDIHQLDMTLEVSKHFEEGAKKYGDNNWRKGIPVRCYIDSAVRHYLKFCRGDKDEPHDRAFCWNIMCAIWTCKHHPELNEYGAKEPSNKE